MEQDSLFFNLGLKVQDEICGVNGKPITQIDQAIEQLSNIDNMSKIDLCIIRGGKKVSFTYNIN